jgi:hypothetical protein
VECADSLKLPGGGKPLGKFAGFLLDGFRCSAAKAVKFISIPMDYFAALFSRVALAFLGRLL